MILGDEVLLEQVLVNVISNAIKYSPDGSEINMEVIELEDMISFSIADQGIGIEAAEQERIFDKFYRADMSKHIPGTGLGLAICKGIVELHGGTILAKPNKDQGTIITISLPMGEENKRFHMQEEGET
jgi:two-component system sensor histidine kinase KdpD